MNDLISRQAVIDALEWKWAGKAALDAIKKLPPAQQWIPCSERMPEKYDEYYVTWTSDNFKRPLIEIIECDETNEFDYELYRFKMEWLLNETMKAYDNPKIIAWMPLPEPYEEVRDD